MDLAMYPTAVLYAVLALITAGVGVAIIVWQTGATQHALVTRRSFLAGGVLLVLLGAVVMIAQITAIVTNSYGTLG